jgi:hypothetical protein
MRPEVAGVFSMSAIVPDLQDLHPQKLRVKEAIAGALGVEAGCGTLLLRAARKPRRSGT